MWGMPPKLLQMTLLGLCGGLLGVLFMIPLRRFLIEKEHGKLPYPEGTACAEVLVASEIGGAKARNVFTGLAAGAAFKFIVGWLKVVPDKLNLALPFIPKAELGMKMNSALFGVGYILGPRIAAVMVGGGLLSALVIIPIIASWGAGQNAPVYPEQDNLISEMSAHDIWNRYIRYIGAGAVAVAGLLTLIRSIPTMIESFRLGARQIQERMGADGSEAQKKTPRTQRDLSFRFVGAGVLIIALALAIVPQIFGPLGSIATRAVAALCVVVFAFFFVTVASRIVGLVGVTSNPTSGMTIAALLGTSSIFLLFGWTDATGMAAALTVGCVVAIAASIAGDTSQDLKTGFLLGATPNRQQVGELIGVLTSAAFVCMTLLLLDQAYGFGSEDLPAPQATLMKLVIEGVLQQKLPWGLVGIGGGIALLAALFRLPALPFAVGVYLPVSTMVPVFLGGLLRLLMQRRAASKAEKDERRERGVLFASGLVGGEGLFGVIIAGVVFAVAKTIPPGQKPTLPSIGTDWAAAPLPELAAAALFALLIILFIRAASRTKRRGFPIEPE
jgi:putative OPT family oligopeptide transporter